MDRISSLRQKAYRGTLNLREMQELVGALDNLPKEIQQEISRNLRYSKRYQEMLFEKYNFASADILGVNDNVLEPLQNSLKNATAKTSRAVGKILKYGIASGAENDELTQAFVKYFKELKVKGQTLANTARLALTRTASLDKLIASGAKYFKYVGPRSGIRQFCADHIDRIYTLDEILKMDNGHGLPVFSYCGGWNCRHRWVAVSESDYLAWKLSKPPAESDKWRFKDGELITDD